VDGSHGGQSVDSSNSGHSSGVVGIDSSVGVVGHGVDGLSNGLLDDGLALDGDGVGHGIRLVNMHGSGHLDDVLLVDRHVIGHLNTSLNIDGLVDGVDLGLSLDNGSVDRLGVPQVGADADGQEGGGGLVDVGGVSGHVAGLAVVHLLGDHRGGLGIGGHTSSLGLGGIGGGQADSRGSSHSRSNSNSWGSSVADSMGTDKSSMGTN